MTTTVSTDGREFFERIEGYLDAEDVRRVQRAFEYTRTMHGDELRKSGEPFYTHPLTVAHYLAEYNLDADTLIAALLHDVAEDTDATIEQLCAMFGPQVAKLVDGVTKFEESAEKTGRTPHQTTTQ